MADRILEAAVEFEVDLARLAQAVLVYDQTLMGDSLAVERGVAAVLAMDRAASRDNQQETS